MVGEKYNAEDITQNVFLKLYENLGNIRKTQSVVSWLYTTARNEVYNNLRRKKIKKEDLLGENFECKSYDDLVGEFENAELKELINKEVNEMKMELKEVFLLREYSELSYKEISGILSIEENQVKGRLFRARQKIIEKISKLAR